MNNKYIVYTERHKNGEMDRWYYGTYSQNDANVVAESLGSRYVDSDGYVIYHCVCESSEAKDLNILNLPKCFYS